MLPVWALFPLWLFSGILQLLALVFGRPHLWYLTLANYPLGLVLGLPSLVPAWLSLTCLGSVLLNLERPLDMNGHQETR